MASCEAEEEEELGPSAASLCRARYRLDAMLMIGRRLFWQRHGYASHVLVLGSFGPD